MFCCSKFDLIGMLLNKEDFLYKNGNRAQVVFRFQKLSLYQFFVYWQVVRRWHLDDATYIDLSKSTLLQKSSIVSQQTRSSAALVFLCLRRRLVVVFLFISNCNKAKIYMSSCRKRLFFSCYTLLYLDPKTVIKRWNEMTTTTSTMASLAAASSFYFDGTNVRKWNN